MARWPAAWQRIGLTLAAAALGALIGLQGLSTPAPVSPKEPIFSAIRAADLAKATLGDAPRPLGSMNASMAVERLAEYLRQRGMEVQVDEATVKRGGQDTVIRNVVARRSGTKPGPAIMLMAHHDSASGAPGACDDGMGVGIALEAAGALCNDAWKGRDVIILLTDGEESGLLGARHFAANHPWRDRVGVVLNVDNRGNRGPCLLYETSGDDARLMQAAGPFMAPVVANSLFAEVARRMPNTTDLAVFRDLGVPGMNFALVDGHEHYHAPTDTWANADLSALQHEGQMVLGALYALAMQNEEGTKQDGRAVFLDVAGQVLAWWPARAGLTCAIGCTLALAASAVFGSRMRIGRTAQLPMAAAAAVVQMVVAVLATAAMLWLASLVGVFGMDAAKAAHAQDSLLLQYRAAFWPSFGPTLLGIAMLFGLAAAWLAGRAIVRRIDGMSAIWGTWIVSSVLVTMLAFAVPGATAPLLPVLLLATLSIAAGTFALEARGRTPVMLALVVPAFVAGLTMAPVEALSWIGVGLSMPAFAGVRAAVYALLLLPALAGSRQA